MILRLHPLATLALAALAIALPASGDEPFNGKDLSNWETKHDGTVTSKWTVGIPSVDTADAHKLTAAAGTAAMVNVAAHHGDSQDIFTKQKWGGAFRIEVEFMVPKDSNSGVYVMGEYEVQVLDSWGKADDKLDAGDVGAIYGAAVPKKNASRKPGEWQKFVIEFQSPLFDAGGKKTANGKFLKVELNGTVLHENLEIKGPTPGGITGEEHAEGPLMFQGNHGAVAFRNIKITPLKK